MKGLLDNPPILAGKRGELQRRDEAHLEIARAIFLKEGYSELTISRLAKETGFSRPTLYERFGSKEQLLAELGLRCQREMLSFMMEAVAFRGRARERMVAMGEVIRCYADRYIDDLRITIFSGTDVVLEKASPALQRQHAELDLQMFVIVQDIIDDAIRQGDLICPAGTSAQTLTLTLVAVFDGLAAALNGAVPLKQLGIADPVSEILRSMHVLLDGYSWHPLYSDWDYAATETRVRETVVAGMERWAAAERTSPDRGGG